MFEVASSMSFIPILVSFKLIVLLIIRVLIAPLLFSQPN